MRSTNVIDGLQMGLLTLCQMLNRFNPKHLESILYGQNMKFPNQRWFQRHTLIVQLSLCIFNLI